MKRLLTIGLMLVSAFALTNCSEQIVPPVEEEVIVDETIETTTPEGGIPFEVYANVAEDVDTKTENIGNSTYWVANDQISVFHKPAGVTTYTHNKEFTITNVEKGLFSGNLAEKLGETNDWHFIYPYDGDRSSASTKTPTTTVTIGAAEVPQVGASNKNHIDGELNPMYGSITGLGKNECPDVKMGHLAALVAIKIVHDGGEGPIVIKDASLSVADTPVVGDCVVTFSDSTPTVTASSSNTSTITTVELQDAVTLNEKGDFVTLYAAVIPFETSDKEITITVNGSARTLEKTVKFESGKVTTLKVPVSALTKELASDAFDLTSRGERIAACDTEGSGTHIVEDVVTTNGTKKTITVNGHEVEAYILGSPKDANGNYTTGSITITGFLKDLFAAIPAGFYISGWDNTPAEMTVNNITIWLPQYSEEKVSETPKEGDIDEKSIKYYETRGLEDYMQHWERVDATTIVTDYNFSLNARGGLGTGKDPLSISGDILLTFAPSLKKNIPFRGIPAQGYYENWNTVQLDLNVSHKSLEEANINRLMGQFFASTTAVNQLFSLKQEDIPNEIRRTSVVLTDVVFDGPTPPANWWDLGAIWDFIKKLPDILPQRTDRVPPVDTYDPEWPGSLSNNTEMVNMIDNVHRILMGKQLEIFGIQIKVGEVIVPTKYHLVHMLRDAKVSIEIGTTENGPCAILWGIDATT